MAATSIQPVVVSPLDPGFQPLSVVSRSYRELLESCPDRKRVIIAVEGAAGQIARKEIEIPPPGEAGGAEVQAYVERVVKFMLWSRGGWRIYIAGADDVGAYIRDSYSSDGKRAFDVELMGRVYERECEVSIVQPDEVPSSSGGALSLGGYSDGCRIGFDLGASDYKLAAVEDGKAVFTTEIAWNPKDEPDPEYHYTRITEGLKLAASHLPRVDAIGGSSAGVYVDNRPMVASLFRSVPEAAFEERVKPLFERIQREWNVPLAVINDGDVTALAGAVSLDKSGVLGIAMGSSEAVGYVDRAGKVTGWLNELAFAPVDFSRSAEVDEWSGDIGVGAVYFSQQAVNKLAPAAGFSFPSDVGLPERLKSVQEKADAGDEAASQIFKTIGVYLGYAIPWYAEFYEFDHLLVLGRVTSGSGGEAILAEARRVLETEFRALAERVQIHVPDEESRRVGQAVAAAGLPQLGTHSMEI
jgi:predicted NBD/HSP70 family sugar kinase